MIWEFIDSRLSKGISVVLMVVVETWGSSPGRAGFKLAMGEDGALEGSVGGGKMEQELLEQASELFVQSDQVILKKLDHRERPGADPSGMICGGSQQIAIIRFSPDDRALVGRILRAKTGVLTLSAGGLSYNETDPADRMNQPVFEAEGEWKYREAIGSCPDLYIFGGGHVGLALSRLFSNLDFRVIVLDNRSPKLRTLQENHFADEIRLIDYAQAERFVPDGPRNYVVIATASHESDGMILDQLLSKKINYLGMLGSDKKVAHIRKVLGRVGWRETDLARVDAPAGLPIGSQTPMEIAVSIAARIIQIRNGKSSG